MDSSALDLALQNAIDGKAILFLGAGASRNSRSISYMPLPDASGLVQLLCNELGVSNKGYALPAIAQHFRKVKGTHKLIEILKANLLTSSVEPGIASLLSLPWRRIYTTNYDNVAETALPKSKTFAIGDDNKNVTSGAIVHLNGFVGQANIHSFDSDLVLTDWSYAQSELFSSSWLTLFTTDVFASQSIIFAGYSMRDLDISRALIRESGISARCVIVVGPDEDPIEVAPLERYGAVYATGMDYVFARLKQAKKAEPSILPPLLDSFHHLEPTAPATRIDRSDVLFDQFVFGRVDESLLLMDGAIDQQVALARPIISERLDSAIQDGISDVVLFGGIGAGKTVATVLTAKHLRQKGFKVFRCKNRRNSIKEIDEIVRFYGASKIALIFENYQRHTDEIEYFCSVRRPGDITIMTARSPIHELYEGFVERVTSKRYVELPLDKLTFDDLVDLDELLNYAGLWKEHSGRTSGARIKMAQESLGANMGRIMLDVVRSNDIRDRVTTEISKILEDHQASKLFVAALIVNAMQYEFWVRDWQNFFSVRDLQKIIAQHKDALVNFVNLSASHWSTNSSLLSAELLHSVIGNAQIVDTLVEIFRVSDKNKSFDQELSRLRIDLMRYNQVEGIINQNGKSSALREYYRRIRSIGDTANNSDYWLQYGIVLSIHANLFDSRDLQEAELAFENAYSRESAKKTPRTIRIDNYYSRFQLQKSVVLTDHVEAAKLFMEASQKLMRQVFDEETRHYPFKVGRLYTDIAANHYEHWEAESQQRFVERCREMVRHGEARLKEQDHKDVRFLVNDLDKLLTNMAPT